MPDTSQSIAAVLCIKIEEKTEGGRGIKTSPKKAGLGTHAKKTRCVVSLKKKYTHKPKNSSNRDTRAYSILALAEKSLGSIMALSCLPVKLPHEQPARKI